MKQKFVLWFKEVNKNDIASVGGKGANLGEMTKAGFPVPPGFIVTSASYEEFLKDNSFTNTISNILSAVDINNNDQLNEASKKIKHLITHGRIPKLIASEIIKAYFYLPDGAFKHPVVAVRSSATAEDLPGASFAGQQETFLNVQGEANVLEKVRDCWASLFTPRAIFYRASNHFDHFKIGIAVPVQKMINSEKSGILFTVDPVTNDKHKIVIEAIYGLGELIVQGTITPDHYEVNKKTNEILKKVANMQEKMMVKKGRETVVVPLTKTKGNSLKLTDKEILAISELGTKLEKHYFFPQDAEWAIEKGHIYIVQTRPVTTLQFKSLSKESGQFFQKQSALREILLKGDPASPGLASGPVKILSSAAFIDKIKPGDVLVAPQTNPDYVPAMKKAIAIITERGGRTSHAAIVSRELGTPAVVGCKNVMKTLKDGMVVTVNGSSGEISRGGLSSKEKEMLNALATREEKIIKTATKIYVNLAEPERAKKIGSMHVDGVGLLRAEFMIAGIGIHPKKFIEEKRQTVFINALSEQLEEFCKAFNPRPVIYRATDFKTNEYRNLKGGKAYEPEEPNPMLGFRGAARYVANPDVFKLELEAIKKVRNKLGYKNLHLMLPFVRTPKELLDVKQIIGSVGLSRSTSFKLYLMVEIPANIIRIDDFLDVGIDGISIGSNDLTMLILGTDRDNSEVAHDFYELDPAVIWALEHVIKACSKRGVTSSICGQAPSDYPELVEKLVSWGITSISVNPDAIYRVRETVANAEKKLIK